MASTLSSILFFAICCLPKPTIAKAPEQGNLGIRQATYSYPIAKDPTIFNEPLSQAAKVPPTQLRGEVYWPSDASCHGSLPVVLLFSGKHPDCRTQIHIPDHGFYPWDSGAINANGSCPGNQSVVASYRGFDYLGRSLAEQGFAAISIDPVFLNNNPFQAKDDSSLNAARGRLLLRTVEILRQWDANSKASKHALGFDISGRVDFSRIGAIGHSRGGAGVRMAYNMLMTPQRLPSPEIIDWKHRLNASIIAIMEVAPFFLPEGQGILPSVVGAPWALVGAGCESDEIDYEYLAQVQQQSRLNPKPNFFLNIYGANHEYFNTEWHEAVDACLGDQQNTWDSAAPKYNISTPEGGSVDIPLVLGSPTQRAALQEVLSSMMRAFLGNDTNASSTLHATSRRSMLKLSSGIQIGLQNPNIASSRMLQDFQGKSIQDIIKAPETIRIESFSAHASSQFPLLQSQIQHYGPPPFYKTLLQVPALPPLDISLADNVTYENGVVLTVPQTNNSSFIPQVQVQLGALGAWKCSSKGITIQVDLARRSNCLLPSLATRGTKVCANPRQRQVKLRVITSEKHDAKTVTVPAAASLTSRFTFEWTPSSLEKSSNGIKATMGLLPVAWETNVLEMTSDAAVLGGRNLTLELDFNDGRIVSSGNAKKGGKAGDEGSDFVYISNVRGVCS